MHPKYLVLHLVENIFKNCRNIAHLLFSTNLDNSPADLKSKFEKNQLHISENLFSDSWFIFIFFILFLCLIKLPSLLLLLLHIIQVNRKGPFSRFLPSADALGIHSLRSDPGATPHLTLWLLSNFDGSVHIYVTSLTLYYINKHLGWADFSGLNNL